MTPEQDEILHLRLFVDELYRRLSALEGASGASGITTGATTLGANTEGDDTADTADWDLYTDRTALELWLVTDVVYSDAGDEKLYAMKRKLTVDSAGNVRIASAETRVEVDVPEDCP